MNLGFFIILGTQFLSALADNTLFIAALFLLKQQGAPEWHASILLCSFTVSYIILAPFAGAFADSMHKRYAMMVCNAIKLIGCIGMFLGGHPLLSYALVGLGAAAYSPAKYGIITEYVSAERLVVANSWLEGTTVAAIIFGTALGGLLISPSFLHGVLYYFPMSQNLDTAQVALMCIILIYLIASWLNCYIPRLNVQLKPLTLQPRKLIREFKACIGFLWRDREGQLSLAVTTFLWGIGATMRLVVINWAIIWLSLSLEKASQLVAIIAIGTMIGAGFAGKYIPLKKAFQVLPTGILIGAIVISMIFVNQIWVAIILMIITGGLSGFLVVPLNAMLQHRGQALMGAGHSIAVQNFNENIGILVMVGLHALIVKYFSGPVPHQASLAVVDQFATSGGIPPMYAIIIGGGTLFALAMFWATLQYRKMPKNSAD